MTATSSQPSSPCRPILFLLKAGFEVGGQGPFFCPECSMLEGLLSCHSELQTALQVRRLEFPRPRGELVELLGEAFQSCPALVFDAPDAPPEAQVGSGQHAFIAGAKPIAEYLAARYGVSRPHS